MDSPQLSPSPFPFLRLPLEIRQCIYDHLIRAARRSRPFYPFSGFLNRLSRADRCHLHIHLGVISTNSLRVRYKNLTFPSGLLYASSQTHLEFSRQIQIKTHSVYFEGDTGKDEVERIVAFIAERPWIRKNIQHVIIGLKKTPVDEQHVQLLYDTRSRFPGRDVEGSLEEDAHVREHSLIATVAQLLKWGSFRRLQAVYLFPFKLSVNARHFHIASLDSFVSLDSEARQEGVDEEGDESRKPQRHVDVWVLATTGDFSAMRAWDSNSQVWERMASEGKSGSVLMLRKEDRKWVEYGGIYSKAIVIMVRLGDMVKAVEDMKEWSG